MQSEIREQHRWLAQLVGDWTYEFDCGGDQPMKATGTERVRPLGALWTLAETSSTMPDGTPALTQLTLGFDPAKDRFVGTFIGSMMSHLWVYEGSLDETGTVLTLAAEGPDCEGGGGTARYHDILTITGPDTREFTSRVLEADGGTREIMTMRYRRAA
jgi:hypothetical protein